MCLEKNIRVVLMLVYECFFGSLDFLKRVKEHKIVDLSLSLRKGTGFFYPYCSSRIYLYVVLFNLCLWHFVLVYAFK